jgi:hypothetical protein
MTAALGIGFPLDARITVTSIFIMGGGGTYFRPRFISVWKAKAGTSDANSIESDMSRDRERNCRLDMSFIVFNPAEGGKWSIRWLKKTELLGGSLASNALNLLFAVY